MDEVNGPEYKESDYPDFSAKLLLAQNGLFQHFLKVESLLLAGNRLKCWALWLGCMGHHPYVWESSRVATFWAKLPKSSRPISLINFQNSISVNPCVKLKYERGINRKYFRGN